MIQLGTVAAIGFEDFPPREWLGCFRQLGCRVVQAYRNAAASVTLDQMRQALDEGGMPCDSLHGIFGEQYDPSNPDEAGRQFAVQTYRGEGDLCRQLGGHLVVVHCATIRRQGVCPQERALRVAQLKKSISDLGRHGRDIGIKYAFENLPAYHAIGSDVAELAAMLREVAAPNTGMCFDTGHAHMVGDLCSAMRSAGEQMIYAHISNNSGSADSHEMITCGTIDAPAMARTFRQIGYGGTIMLEVFYTAARLRELIEQGLADRLASLVRIANGDEAYL